MAAPKDENPGNSKGKRYDEELDIMSPNFKPIKALYSEDEIDLPSKDVTQFNNIAEYESFMKRKDRGNPGNVSKPTDTEVPKKKSSSGHTKTKEMTSFQDEYLRKRRERMNRNVLTRMETLEKGPLSLLRRCVQEKLLVKVWTRGAVELRGMCKGYIVAFDKHFNLAMIDVDELFRCPLTRDINIKKAAKAEKRYVKYMKKKLSKKTDENVSETISIVQNTCQVSQESQTSTDNQKGSEPIDNTVVTDNANVCSSDNTASTSSSISQQTRTKSQDTATNVTYTAEETLNQKGLQEKVISEADCETQDDGATEQKSGAISLLERHVNQLFIRGDNVVSVAILD